MPSRRYYIGIAPIEHLNGKLAPCRVKCPNTDDPDKVNEGFFYGYRRRGSSVSRFGVRTLSRNLNTHPVTAAEDENRTLFTAALFAVYDHQQQQEDWNLMLKDYHAQNDYATAIGYAVAKCRANGGEWLHKWTSS